MKKIKNYLLVLVLLFSLIVSSACFLKPSNEEQIDIKAELNTTGLYEAGNIEDFNALTTNENFNTSIEKNYKVSLNMDFFGMTISETMIVNLDEDNNLNKFAMKLEMSYFDTESSKEVNQSIKLYLKDNILYFTGVDDDGITQKLYARLEDYNEFDSFISMKDSFEIEEFLSNIDEDLSSANVEVFTEDTTTKYKISYVVDESSMFAQLGFTGNIEIYFVLEDEELIGYSLNIVENNQSKPMVTVVKFDEEIQFPDFSDYVEMQEEIE